MRKLTKAEQTSLLEAVTRAEQGAAAGRIVRLCAWQELTEGAWRIRNDDDRRDVVARVDALWPDVEAIHAPRQRDLRAGGYYA